MTTLHRPAASEFVTTQDVEYYRANGFVRVRNIISREEALSFREAALRYAERGAATGMDSAIFTQLVNVWRQDEAVKALTMHPNIAAVAQELAGVNLRLWHDQLLIKNPGKSKATEFHQDQPYWPHEGGPHPISCWIALGDVPVERGCMTFLPGSQHRTDLPAQLLSDDKSLFSVAPDLTWSERVTLPLQAGDCTFHHGRCAHMATPNLTDEARVAHVVIFMDEDTRFTGQKHTVTRDLGLQAGQTFPDDFFPRIL